MDYKFGKEQMPMYIKKTILCFVATFFTSIGIAMFITIDGGSDSITVWIQGLQKVYQAAFDPTLKYGAMSLAWNIFLLIFAIIFARKHVFIGTFVAALMLGQYLLVIEPFFHTIIPADLSTKIAVPFISMLSLKLPSSITAGFVQILLLLLANTIMSAGIGLTVSLRFGQVAINGLLFKISELTGFQFKWLRVATEAILMTIGWFLGGVFGIGSVISALMTGPMVVTWAKFYNRTILKVLKIDDPQNEFKVKKKNDDNEMTMQPSE